MKPGDMVRMVRCVKQREQPEVGMVLDLMALEWPDGDPLFDGSMELVAIVMWPDGRDDEDLPQMCWLRDLQKV
jgi:hypothetical protein